MNGSEPATPEAGIVAVLASGVKVKQRALGQRACNQKSDKGKLCAGHLKRWYFFGDEVRQKFGSDAEIYRCQNCGTLYLPNPGEETR